MARRPLSVALVSFASLLGSGCPDEGGVSQLSAVLSASPRVVTVDPLWAGHPTAVPVVIHNGGDAPVSSLVASVVDETGPVDVAAAMPGDALGPGASFTLTLTVSAPPGATGSASAVVVLEAGVDGALPVEVSAEVRTPPSCDDQNPCTSDRFDAARGTCAHTTLDDGASCDDGSACTAADACLAGRCVGEAVTCADDVACTLDTCDPAVGCVFEPVPSRCDDDDPCTDDVCAPATGCENPPLAEGAVCHFDGCAEIGLCFLGTCVRSEVPDGMPCEDGDACTAGDTCQAGECTSGAELGLGAAPPLVLDPTVYVDLCRGPGAGPDCFGVVTDPGLERVLATDVVGRALRVVWQGGYVDSYGATCDPTDPVFAPLNLDPPEQPNEAPGGGAMPSSFMCAAGVYLTTLDLSSAVAAPTTTQLTAVRGPAAAAFVRSATGDSTLPSPDVGGDAEPPPPPLPLEGDVVIVHPDYLRTSVWIEERRADGVDVTGTRRHGPWSLPDTIARLAVDASGAQTVVVAHGTQIDMPDTFCDGPGCDLVPVPLWAFGEPRGDMSVAGFDRLLWLERLLDLACVGVGPGPLPLVIHDLSVFADAAAPRVSLRMSRSLCGDVAPGTLGVPDDAERPVAMSGWSFVFAPHEADDGVGIFPPLAHFASADAALTSFRTTSAGSASAMRQAPAPCDCAPCAGPDEEPGVDCACVPLPGTCFETVVERALQLDDGPPEALLSSVGARVAGQTVPLEVEGELRVAALLGDHVELLGRGLGGALSRIAAPPPADGYHWDAAAPLLAGPAGSSVVVGEGVMLPEPVFPLPRQALVQVFGCGLGDGATSDACLEDVDCAEGSTCDRSVCLPGPDCAATSSCDLCWGRCVAPPDDDGGMLDHDGGSSDDGGSNDGGTLDDDAGSNDAGDAG